MEQDKSKVMGKSNEKTKENEKQKDQAKDKNKGNHPIIKDNKTIGK